MDLRDYQRRAKDAVLTDYFTHGLTSVLVEKATGLGKTVLFGHVAEHFVLRALGRVLVVAHRRELIRQAADKIGRITGRQPDVEMGDERADVGTMWGQEPNPYVVASVQTLQNRLAKFTPDDFALVVVDEAHRAVADSYQAIFEHFRTNRRCRFLLVTATPDRADGERLGRVVQKISFRMDVHAGVDQGWLVPIRQRVIEVEGLDFSRCRTTAGDLNQLDLAQVMEYEENLHGIATPTIELAGDRSGVIFLPSVTAAERMAEILNRHRPHCAVAVSGKTDPILRRGSIRRFDDGDVQFLVNCDVFTEGWDSKRVQVVVDGSPTKSRPKFVQRIGRGTRPDTEIPVDTFAHAELRRAAIAASRKPYLEVLSFAGNAGKHKLITTVDVLGEALPEEEKVALLARIAAAGEAVDVKQAVQLTEEELAERARLAEEERLREAANRARLVAQVRYSSRFIDPFDLFDLAPTPLITNFDQDARPSPKDVAFLEKFGYDRGDLEKMPRKHVGQIKRTTLGRLKRKLVVRPKQIKVLKDKGYDTSNMPEAEARQLLNQILGDRRGQKAGAA